MIWKLIHDNPKTLGVKGVRDVPQGWSTCLVSSTASTAEEKRKETNPSGNHRQMLIKKSK